MTLNPLRAWRAYLWRRRVEWFAEAARRARFWRDNPFNLKTHPPQLIHKSLDCTILVRDWQPKETRDV
ncbi:hypothetical protein [Nocardia sp. NPDC046763]|uniref:hypothetical protein n=1 Tax=Nocardia sp. NPDC046763 TaxID=3155256 RepID=UPI0034038807